MDEAREIEWRREQEARRSAAAETADPADDREVVIEQRLHDIRSALDELERQLHAGARH